MTNPTPPPIGQRAALLLFAALVSALVVGTLTFLAYGNVAGAVLAGIGALGASFTFLHIHVRGD